VLVPERRRPSPASGPGPVPGAGSGSIHVRPDWGLPVIFVRLFRAIGTALGPDSRLAWALLGWAARRETRHRNRRGR